MIDQNDQVIGISCLAHYYDLLCKIVKNLIRISVYKVMYYIKFLSYKNEVEYCAFSFHNRNAAVNYLAKAFAPPASNCSILLVFE